MAGSITRSNGGSATSATSAATSWASGSAAVGADLVLIVGASNVLSGTPTGYTQRGSAVNNADVKVYTRTATGNASDTPTINLGGTGDILWKLLELAGTSGLDVAGTMTNSGTNATSQAMSATPTAGNRFALGILECQQASGITWAQPLAPTWSNSFVDSGVNIRINGAGGVNDAQWIAIGTISASMTATSQSTTASNVDSAQLTTQMLIFAESGAATKAPPRLILPRPKRFITGFRGFR